MTSPLQIEYTIHFRRRGRGATKEIALGAERVADAPPRVPRLARLMALAIRLDHLVRAGVVKDYTMLARLGQVSRARVSQITALVHLAPDIQEALLFLLPRPRGRALLRLADLLPLTKQTDWTSQRRSWRRLGARGHGKRTT